MAQSQFSDHEEKNFSIFDISLSNLNVKRLWCAQNREAYFLIAICLLLLLIPLSDKVVFGYILATLLLLFSVLSFSRWLFPGSEKAKTISKNINLLSIERIDTILPSWIEGILSVSIASALIYDPELFLGYVIRGVGMLLLAWFLISLFMQLNRSETAKIHSIAWYVFMASVGVLLILSPLLVVRLISSVLAVSGIVVAMIVVLVNLFAGRTRSLTLTKMPSFFLKWLADRSVTKSDREHLYSSIFFEGRDMQKRTNHFIALMGMSSVIASFGVLANSTAVVIGAMLVAPLMTPLMALTTSIAMGWPKRLLRSLTLSTMGAMIGIASGWVISFLVPGDISLIENGEVSSRILPTLLDLGIAVAAGAAGAYSMSRPDLSDSLPGVAVSIALVPPLAVTGIALEQGAFSDASGSFLLFLTNAVAILIAGGVVMILTGVTPISRIKSAQRRLRTVLLALEMVAIIVIGALILNGANIASNALVENQTRSSIVEWLGGDESDFRLNSLRFEDEGRTILLEVTGPENPPSAEILKERLRDETGRDFSLDILFTEQQRQFIN